MRDDRESGQQRDGQRNVRRCPGNTTDRRNAVHDESDCDEEGEELPTVEDPSKTDGGDRGQDDEEQRRNRGQPSPAKVHCHGDPAAAPAAVGLAWPRWPPTRRCHDRVRASADEPSITKPPRVTPSPT